MNHRHEDTNSQGFHKGKFFVISWCLRAFEAKKIIKKLKNATRSPGF